VRVRLGQMGSTTAADCQLFLWQAERTTRRHSRDDPREDVGVNVRVRVGVGPEEFHLYLLNICCMFSYSCERSNFCAKQ